MNKLKIFENQEFGRIRAIEKDGEPWFVGKDVAEALGYSDSKSAISDHVECHLRYFESWIDRHQRVRSLQPDLIQQVADGEKVQTLGNFRGVTSDPQNGNLFRKVFPAE